MRGRHALWLPLVALIVGLAGAASAQYDGNDGNGGIDGEVTGNVTAPEDDRDQREDRNDGGGDRDGRDLRPLWYFLGALAVVGIAIALFVAMRNEH